MKRYWKVITLCLGTILILGGFYIKAVAVQSNGYNLELKDISGDRAVVKGLTIKGDLNETQRHNYATFKLREDSLEYESDLSFLNSLDGVFSQAPRIHTYVKDYRSFMRGKETNPLLFSEDEEYIAYATEHSNYQKEQDENYLLISRVSRETKKSEEFSYSLDSNDTNYYVADTFYLKNKLYILTQQTQYNENVHREKYELFVWNFDTQKMDIEKKVIEFLPDEKNKEVQLIEANPSENNLDYAGFLVTSGDSYDEFASLQGNLSSHAFLFEYETANITEVKNETSIPFSENFGGILTSDAMYLFTHNTDPTLLKVNIQQETPLAEKLIEGTIVETTPFNDEPIEFEEEVSEDDISEEQYPDEISNIVTIHEQKMYTLSSIQYADTDEPAILTVMDIQTGEELYKGKIEINQGDKLPMNYELYFQTLYFTAQE